jgi:hypothetical protein
MSNESIKISSNISVEVENKSIAHIVSEMVTKKLQEY